MKNILVGALFLLSTSVASARETYEIRKGEDLLVECKAAISVWKRNFAVTEKEKTQFYACHNYVAGYVHATELAMKAAGMKRVMCVIKEPMPKILAAIVKELESSEENLDKHAGFALFFALTNAFPCE